MQHELLNGSTSSGARSPGTDTDNVLHCGSKGRAYAGQDIVVLVAKQIRKAALFAGWLYCPQPSKPGPNILRQRAGRLMYVRFLFELTGAERCCGNVAQPTMLHEPRAKSDIWVS